MRVLILGDSPTLTTGFGRVNARVVERLLSNGHEVASVGGLLTEKPEKGAMGIQHYVPTHPQDVLGIADIVPAVRDFKPDVLYMTADPGSVVAVAMGAPDMPAFVYAPVEGEPLVNRDWRAALTTLHAATVSEYGANVVKRDCGVDIPWYYHGVDHETFQQTGIRDELRQKLGWQDKTVLMTVSTNVRRKQIPRIIEAFAKLVHVYKRDDVILYLHTVPFQQYWLEGWNLMEVLQMYNVADKVFFHPSMTKRNSSVPVRTDDSDRPGLVEMYNAADIFILASQVEGFGLPIAEAMACGVPVAVTKYAAGWEVARPAGVGLDVGDWEVHKSGTVYANVSVDAMAKKLLKLIRNPNELERMRQRGLERVRDFDWAPFEDDLNKNLELAQDAYAKRHSKAKEEDSWKREKPWTEAQEQVSIRKKPTENSAEKGSLLIEGQGEDSASQGAANVPRPQA